MKFKILANKREKKEKLEKETIPAVMYGNEVETQSLKLRKVDFEKIFAVAGESNLIDLEIDGTSEKVLVKDVQKDPINLTPIHVDFYKVNMAEKVMAEIPFIYVGESKAVKELGGMLNKEMDSIEVECLPNDLVSNIEIDISGMNELDDVIRVSDLKLPATMEITNDPEDVIANIIEPREEIEEEVEEVEGEEGAEAAEGEKKDAEGDKGDAKEEDKK